MLEENFCQCLFFTVTRLKKIAAKIAEDELKRNSEYFPNL